MPQNYTVKLSISVNNVDHLLTRKGNKIDWKSQSNSATFPLNKDNTDLLKAIFKCDNASLLSNILGTFYIDQESGWVVFNRGKVIGKIDYNIDKLIFSLSGLDSSLFTKRKILTKEIQNYQKVLGLYKNQQPLFDYGRQETPLDQQIIDIQQKIDLTKSDLLKYKKQKKSYEDLATQNKKMWDYIDSLKISVVDGDRRIKITKNNIEGLTDTQEYHQAIIHRYEILIADKEFRLSQLRSELEMLLATQNVDNEIYNLGARSSINLDSKVSKRNLEILSTHAKTIDDEIRRTVTDKPFELEMNNNLLQFAEKLGISEDIDKNKLILKNNFQSYAGTIKQKMVLAYRCAALVTVSKYLGVKLPIIIDSINRETDADNIKIMFDFLKKELGDHQIIISTIVDLGSKDPIQVSKPLIKEYDPLESNEKLSIY